MSQPVGDDDVEFLPILPDEDDLQSKPSNIPDELPLLPLRNTILLSLIHI